MDVSHTSQIPQRVVCMLHSTGGKMKVSTVCIYKENVCECFYLLAFSGDSPHSSLV